MKSALFISFLATILFANTTQIVLSDSSAVDTEYIRLGQIATISGEHKSLLDTLRITSAAPAGFSRFLLKNNIMLPEEIRKTTTIVGADRIKIYSLSQKIPYTELAKNAAELLADSLWNSEYVKSEISFEFAPDAKLNIALGNYKVILGKMDAKQLKGRVQIPLVVVQNNGEKRTRALINASINVTARVCVAAKDMARHEKFAPQNLEYKTVDISTLKGMPLFEMPKVDDYQIIGVIRKGTIITDRHIAPKPVIEIGTPVRMTTGEGMVKVSIMGRARSAGGIGDIISIENVESNRIVKAKVIGHGAVEIVRGSGTI